MTPYTGLSDLLIAVGYISAGFWFVTHRTTFKLLSAPRIEYRGI